MAELIPVLVNGAPFAVYTTLANAAGLVDKINRTYEGKPATLDLSEAGPMFNPSHADALTVLDTLDALRRKQTKALKVAA